MLKKFSYAWNGILVFFREEKNSKIHAFITLIVLILAYILKISKTEWVFIMLAIALVFISEIFNTAIEKVVQKVHPQYDPLIKKVLDLSAAGVLFAAFFAVITGLMVFLPHIISYF
jgi:diacylglycerol kinase (ATP)